MYDSHDDVRDRHYQLLREAARQRRQRRVRRVNRASRRAERADRQLSRFWHEATQRRAELARLTADPWA